MTLLYKKKNSLNHYAVISIAIVLFILEIYLIIILHTRNLSEYFKEQVAFVIELEDSISPEQIDIIHAKLMAYPEVVHDKIEYLDKEEALKTMLSELDEKLISEEKNPFKALYVFYLKAENYNQDNINKLNNEISSVDGVLGFYHANESFENVISNISKANWFLFVTLLFLVLLVLIILFSTIRIKLLNNRFQIKTMELVGAENKHIQGLYQKDSHDLLIKSMVLSLVILVMLILWLHLKYNILNTLIEIQYIAISVLFSGLIAYLIVYITTKIQVNSYISKHFYELYES